MRGSLIRSILQGRVASRRSKFFVNGRVKIVAAVLVTSLLIGSITIPTEASDGLNRINTKLTHSQLSESFLTPLSFGLQIFLTSFGKWLANYNSRDMPHRETYYPVAAFIGPPSRVIDAPSNLMVTVTTATGVSLSWTAPAGAVVRYQVERSQNVLGPFLVLATPTGTTFTDSSVSNATTYLYRIRAIESSGLPSAPSNMAVGTAMSFQLSALKGQVIRAQHVNDLRTAVNAVRRVANIAPATWTRNSLIGLVVEANDIQELRDRLDEALSALGISVSAYEDATLSVGANGTPIKVVHFEELQARSSRGSSSTSGPPDSDSTTARLDPLNETGGSRENPLSRNFNWSLPLVSLPGRAGMDLDLTLSYNSLVWTKSGSSISFDTDGGSPSPGFRLGLPVIQPLYYNREIGKFAFLLIGDDGKRTELRQVGNSSLYEAADSSYMLLDAATMILRSPYGTQFSYVQMGNEFNCTQIKDRNGNYITVNYTSLGGVDTIVDTLARSIKFNYDSSGSLTSITQIWNQGASSQRVHTWASFSYSNSTIQTNFPGSNIDGPANGTSIKTLSHVTRPDGSRVEFSYSTWGQVWKVSNFAADNHLLSYRSYNLPRSATLAHSDCPRFTERRDWAQYWNGDTDGVATANEEAVTAFAVPASETWTMPDGSERTGMRAQVVNPDGVFNRIYFIGQTGTSSGWQRGLPALVNTYDNSGSLQRQIMTTWTQDDTAVSYAANPRVAETNTYDPAGNRARVSLAYQKFIFADGTSCHFPRDIYEYAANGSPVLRSTRIEYNTSTSYTNRRILALVSGKTLFDGDVNNGGILISKEGVFYDETGSVTGAETPVQHDNSNFGGTFLTGRGNISSVRRYDVTNTTQFTSTSSKYNIAGGIVSTKDASSHEVKISYADSFSDGINSRNSFAYPTKTTDPDGNSTSTGYHFDFGAVTRTQSPQPNTTNILPGPVQSFSFDSIGRLQQITSLANNSYARFEYPNSQIRIDAFTKVQEGLSEARSFRITDGVGRVVATAADHPGSVGGFSGQKHVYDIMGRVIQTSNPTETTASGAPSQWIAVGDDTAAGWIYTQQTYDWIGRPLVTTDPSTTGNPANTTTKQVSYSGCGCAGGEVVTLTDEEGRRRRVYSDVLGRKVKNESLNLDGSVYASAVSSYNARNQVTQIREYAGDGGNTFQDTTMTYDGFGRLQSRHVPEQTSGKSTFLTYNADDTIRSVTDARDASQTFAYNNRHLPTSVTYSAPVGITAPAQVGFTYDGAGNRTSMADGLGSATYTYNQLSQVTAESRSFTGVGTFNLTYDYNLAGQLTRFTDPFGAQVGYAHDSVGRVNAVTGSNFASVSSYASGLQYRAWGALKSLTFGNSRTMAIGYDAKLNSSSFEIPGLMKKSYEYYNDGRLKFTQDQLTTNSKFDRFYGYDHLGRMTAALSGAEARGEGPTDDRPYNEKMAYDAFGHLTLREIRHWNRFDSTGVETYVNNRRQGWQYDDDGRLIRDTSEFEYDAAGRIKSFGDWDQKTEQEFDGDGQRAKSTLRRADPETGNSTTEEGTYYIRSSVLGKVVSELSAQGAKQRGFVYLNGNLLAIQATGTQQSVTWEHYDPSRSSYRSTDAQGFVRLRAEMDPMGFDAGLFRPLTVPPRGERDGQVQPYYTVPELGSASECILDRVPIPCEILNRLTEAGGVESETLYRDDDGQWDYYRHEVVSYGVGVYKTRVLKFDGLGSYLLDEEGDPKVETRLFAHASTTPYVDTGKLNECSLGLFGVELRSFTESRRGSNGSFTGTGPSYYYMNKNGAGNNDTFTIATDVNRYSHSELKEVENRFRAAAGKPLLGPNDQINGMTNRLAPLTNFTANDLKDSFAILRNQIHELGHSLDAITGIGYDRQENGEAGKKLVDCLTRNKGFKYR